MKLAGKVGLVTGAARGIGAATAIELARNGADVMVNDIAPRETAQGVLDEIASLGRRAVFFQGDVADRSSDERMVEETVAEFGRLDILVNNAAKSIRKTLLDLEVADVARVWDVMLWGVFHCSQLAARQMVKQGQGGNIVMISSVHAKMAYRTSTAYNCAKAGINHMARTWAVELAQFGIRVNMVEPGWIDTPGERAHFTEEVLQEEGKKLLLGRLGRPDEIAKAVLYLVSDDAAYATGTALRVDGGFVLPTIA